MDAPHNNVTKYLSEDEITHHDSPENIVGMLNCNISFLSILNVVSLILGTNLLFS